MRDELRRHKRIAVCCRVVARDRYGVWTGVTANVNERGCLIVSPRLLRPGSWLSLTLSSDLFPEELEVVAEVVWSTGDRIAISFEGALPREGGVTPHEFIARVLEHGASDSRTRVVPSVRAARTAGATPIPLDAATVRDVSRATTPEVAVERLETPPPVSLLRPLAR